MPTYRIAEAAELLAVSDDTVRRWVDAGRLASHTVDGRAVVSGTDLAALAEQLAEQAEQAADQLSDVDTTATGEVAHPFAGYEKLTGDRVMAHVRDTDDVAELEQILAFESAHKARKGVLAAVQERLSQLSAAV